MPPPVGPETQRLYNSGNRAAYWQAFYDETGKSRSELAPQNSAFYWICLPFIGSNPYRYDVAEEFRHAAVDTFRLVFVLLTLVIWVSFFTVAFLIWYDVIPHGDRWVGWIYAGAGYALALICAAWYGVLCSEWRQLSPVWREYYHNYVVIIGSTHLVGAFFVLLGVYDSAPVPYQELIGCYVNMSIPLGVFSLFMVYILFQFSTWNRWIRIDPGRYRFHPVCSKDLALKIT